MSDLGSILQWSSLKGVEPSVRHVSRMFRLGKPYTHLGRDINSTSLKTTSVKRSSVSMSAEGNYSDRWLNLWKEGLAPGQVGGVSKEERRKILTESDAL